MPKVSHMRVFKQKLGFKANDRWAKSIFGQISKISQFWTHVTNFSGIHRVPKNGERVFFSNQSKMDLIYLFHN